MKAAISLAMAVTATVFALPALISLRYRVQSLTCPFHAIAQTDFGRPASLALIEELILAGYRYVQAPSISARRARALPALVIPPRLTRSPVELSVGTRPR